MAHTNKHSLPIEVVRALSTNRYLGDAPNNKSDYSVTSLIAPIQQTILKKRYPDCGDGDIIDNLWSMFGSIAHTLLEEHGSEDAITEARYQTTVLGKTVSGGLDHYKDGQITDYKVTSVWKIQKKNYIEWEQQLNCYAYLLGCHLLPVKSIRIIAILRDWSAPDGYKPDYPKAPIEIIEIPLWEEYKQAVFISERVRKLKLNESLPDICLTECTDEEMWASPTKWAVVKKGGKRATKVYDVYDEAYTFTLDNPDYDLVERKGERRRCNKYCVVAGMCNQFAQYLKETGNGSIDQSEHIF